MLFFVERYVRGAERELFANFSLLDAGTTCVLLIVVCAGENVRQLCFPVGPKINCLQPRWGREKMPRVTYIVIPATLNYAPVQCV